MKKTLFKGKAKVGLGWVGTQNQPHTRRDKVGEIRAGAIRECLIDTRWGQLEITDYTNMNRFGNKRIKITVETIK